MRTTYAWMKGCLSARAKAAPRKMRRVGERHVSIEL